VKQKVKEKVKVKEKGVKVRQKVIESERKR
jgi:hypothetical protein